MKKTVIILTILFTFVAGYGVGKHSVDAETQYTLGWQDGVDIGRRLGISGPTMDMMSIYLEENMCECELARELIASVYRKDVGRRDESGKIVR